MPLPAALEYGELSPFTVGEVLESFRLQLKAYVELLTLLPPLALVAPVSHSVQLQGAVPTHGLLLRTQHQNPPQEWKLASRSQLAESRENES